jgi:hypothetical protein
MVNRGVMYEFVDSQGERITVRSARTLGSLLISGRIGAETLFRRSEDPEFVAAWTHDELHRIAADVLVTLQSRSLDAATNVPDGSPVAPPERQVTEPIVVPLSSRDTSPRTRTTQSPKSAVSPQTSMTSTAARMALAAKGTPYRPPPKSPAIRAVQRVLFLPVLLSGAALIGAIIGALGAGLTRSNGVGEIMGTLAFWGAACLAGRHVGRKHLLRPHWEALIGLGTFVLISLALAGGLGLLLSGLASAILWGSLRRYRRPSTGHQTSGRYNPL